jgi:hypothetical protein
LTLRHLAPGKGGIRVGSIESEADLNLRPGVNINPPPRDGKCQCCGRHISELKPYGKAGDPLLGDFGGGLLVKRWRHEGPFDEAAESAMEEALRCYKDEGFEYASDWLMSKYGRERGDELAFRAQLHGSIRSSWECRECIVLDEDENFAKMRERGVTTDPEDFIAIPEDKLQPLEELPEFLSWGKKNH